MIQGGLTRVDAAPVVFTLPGEDSSFAVTASEATQLLSVAFDDELDWLDEDGGAMLVSSGIPVNPTVNFFGGPYRFADAIEGDAVTPPTTPTTMTSPFQIAEDQKVFARGRIVLADGRLSNFFGDDFLCAS